LVSSSPTPPDRTHREDAMSSSRLWGHSKIPGRASAREVPSIDAAGLTEERFFRDYVDEVRPCRIVGAVSHWPATKLWRSPDYLLAKIGADREVEVRTHPYVEYPMATSMEAELAKQNSETEVTMSFGEFLRRASAPG